MFAGTDEYVRSVQTLAGLEVVHSLVGMLGFFLGFVGWAGARSGGKEGKIVTRRLDYDECYELWCLEVLL